MSSGTGGSVVIPAHNEQAVIGRTLATLTDGLDLGAVRVVVVANGCADRTAGIARAVPGVEVIEIPASGKTGALNAGEAVLSEAMPRLYLDADIELTGRAATAVLDALRAGAIAARPPITFHTAQSAWPVRRYFAANARIPSVMAELCGGGAYGLSTTARARFAEYPDVVADDLFISRIVAPEEVTVVDTDPLVVRVPRTTRALLAILRRSVRGNREFAAAMPDLARDTTGSTTAGLRAQLRSWRTAPDALVYACFAVAARLLVRFGKQPVTWERDDTSRT